ncbi:MAG: hypothetical protein AB1705_23980 [Verrucomicrobiota bacterium]
MSDSATTAPPAARKPAIISPVVDTLCVGGLSIVAFLPVVLLGQKYFLLPDTFRAGHLASQAIIATLINMPHFMASYSMVYHSKETMLKHKWAAIYVPIGLAAYGVFAVFMSDTTMVYVAVMQSISGIYLAWHYTGQAWGMMATYAFLEGAPFSERERLLVRSGLRILLAWHVTWFCQFGTNLPWIHQTLGAAYFYLSMLTWVAFVLGAVAFYLYWRRTGRMPAFKALVAWLAIFFWYGAMAVDLRAIFWVQIAHALQYLIFPFRVQMNRYERAHPAQPRQLRVHILGYAGMLLFAAYAAEHFLVEAGMISAGVIFGAPAGDAAPIVMLAFLNIHHYFTDGCIWKISNPDVRRDLFAHVPKPA